MTPKGTATAPTGRSINKKPNSLNKGIAALRSCFEGSKSCINAAEKLSKVEKLIIKTIAVIVFKIPGFINIDAGTIISIAAIKALSKGTKLTAINFSIPSPGIIYIYTFYLILY